MNQNLNSNYIEEKFTSSFDSYILPINTNNTEISSVNIQYSPNEYSLNNALFRTSYPQIQQFSSTFTSFDVYGNELMFNRRDLPNSNDELSENNSITEEIFDISKFDKENNDPYLNLITPLKRRESQTTFSGSFESDRRSIQTSGRRSPLLDITPILPKKKSSNIGSKIEVINILDFIKANDNLIESVVI